MHLLPVIWIKIAFHFASCHIRLYGVSRNYGNHSCVLDESKTFLALYSASVRLFCAALASYTIAFDLQFLKKEQNASWKCWMWVGWKQAALLLCAICASKRFLSHFIRHRFMRYTKQQIRSECGYKHSQ